VTESDCNVLLVAGDEIARYGFGDGHPFGPDRHEAFMRELHQCGLDGRVQRGVARAASREELEWFHTPAYVDLVR
jgi:acetoin utilization protein AcuC